MKNGEKTESLFMNAEGLEFGRYRKQHIYDLPYINRDVSDFFDYPEKEDLAFVIPLWENQTEVNRADRHLYHKSAIYTALGLIQHTDVKQTGAKIYFCLNNGTSEVSLAYLRAAGIRDANILFSEMRFSEHLPESHYLFPIEAITHDRLSEKQRVIRLDADIFLYDPTHADYFGQLITEWHPEIPLCLRATTDEYLFHVEKETYTRLGKWDDFQSNMAELLDTSLDAVKIFVSEQGIKAALKSRGLFYGMSREARAYPEIRRLLEASYETEVLLQDESFLCTLIKALGLTEEDVYRASHIPIEFDLPTEVLGFKHLSALADDAPHSETDSTEYYQKHWKTDFITEMTGLWY